MTDTAPEHGGDAPRRPGGRVVRPLLIIVAAVVVIWLVLTVIDEIDFAVVGEALARVSLAQMLVLLAVVLVRQVLNAVPLTAFVPEVGLLRSMQCDAGASVVATFAPPPGDLALRYTMYRSWDVDPVAGFAGFTLNTVLFYVVRFGAPLLGLVGLLVLRWQDDGASGFALTSVAIAAAITVAVVLVARADRAASTVGHIAGRLAHPGASAGGPGGLGGAPRRVAGQGGGPACEATPGMRTVVV